MLLGEGGTCRCWRAIDITRGHFVAIKLYHDEDNMDAAGKARKSEQVHALIRNRLGMTGEPPFQRLLGLLACSDWSSPGVQYLVNPIGTVILHELLRQDAQDLISLAHDVLSAVAALNSRGLIHVDVKPENFLMFGTCRKRKLIDLDGCVLLPGNISIEDATISFTPFYCAPEFCRLLTGQVQSICASIALDSWSTGLVLAQTLSSSRTHPLQLQGVQRLCNQP